MSTVSCTARNNRIAPKQKKRINYHKHIKGANVSIEIVSLTVFEYENLNQNIPTYEYLLEGVNIYMKTSQKHD